MSDPVCTTCRDKTDDRHDNGDNLIGRDDDRLAILSTKSVQINTCKANAEALLAICHAVQDVKGPGEYDSTSNWEHLGREVWEALLSFIDEDAGMSLAWRPR